VKATLFRKPKPLQESWARWFAWYPVTVNIDGTEFIVWLEEVERKQCIGYNGKQWRYREVL
jgi:hypothetical protein